jgi:flagellin-like hook-associated protein FlgL
MAVTNLSSVVNSKFILRFAGLAGSGSSRNPLSGSSTTSISSGLRFGAQAFGQAVQGLNAGISFLNVTRGALEELTEITDKLITLTEKATKISTSSDARKNLQLDFDRIARDFEELVDSGKFGNRKVLSLTDMSEIFTTIGLDKKSSDSIAEIFKQFSAPDSDEDSLASQEVKGTRPYIVPTAAYRKLTSDNSYYLEKISDGPMTAGGISTVNSVYTATDDILNQNTGHVAVFSQDVSGSLETMAAGVLSTDVTLKTVNEVTGYSVIESTENFLGFNGAGVKQLFLVDTSGEVVHQFTNEATAISFGGVSISADNLTIAFSRLSGTDLTVRTIDSAVIGENPTAGVNTVLETLAIADTVQDIQINNDGTYVGYIKTVGASSTMQLRDTATNTADVFLQGETNLISSFGFYDDNKIAIKYDNGPNYDIKLYTDSAGAYTNLKTGVDATTFKTLEMTTGVVGYVGYYDTTTTKVSIYSTSDGTTEIASHTLGSGDTVSTLALSFNSTGQAEAMIGGQLASYSGDSDLELYRLRANPSASSGRAYARSTAEYETIFDGTVDILTRPNAYRMLHDLKAMKAQLADNIDGVNYATDIILKNID